MKNILVVIESVVSAKLMLEKSMMFSPEKLQVVLLGQGDAESIRSTLNQFSNKHCKAEMIMNSGKESQSVSETISQIVKQTNPDMVVVHRPNVGRDKQEYTLAKAVLKSAGQTTVLLCSDNSWHSKMKIIATLDMVDESPAQKLLNTKVLDVAMDLLSRTPAKLTLMSVLEISRIRDELEIAVSTDLMGTKGKIITTKLEDMIKAKDKDIDVSTHVSIGVPSKEIPLMAKKLKANMVIMGNVGRTGIKGLIIGNTAEKILEQLRVDTIVVKT
ncbi:universal stress protein [Paraglaciecola sp. MB-3u-78]|jgi:universal stress protein E|uniref:universal stress protein n=1 Tax=Paraglaciecola sp. MB-3u-78 TaxID=2058332 RepID=UPI000C32A562|nr:universal stress protein [Paraglaciecola sp. MB-3u-78]PKG99959.1 hypothetical protein CXF95_04700 [Paraglaciecola sp. MB-3u-78]